MKMWNLKRILILLSQTFIILALISKFTVECSKRQRFLKDDDNIRRNNRPSECQFGKTIREIGATWYADLGPPFGVMYCIKCECIKAEKRRRIVGKVQCRNIKDECPKLTCDDPIQLPGKCCKTCSDEDIVPDVAQDVPIQQNPEEEERNMKHFAALLSGRTSHFLKREETKNVYTTQNPQNIVATGRFTFHRKNLYYSFYISEQAQRPKSIQFIDANSNILEEQTLVIPTTGPDSIYQNATGKICGVWRRVHRDYRRQLRDEQINVILIWGEQYRVELALGGRIERYPALSTELFSSLLEPAIESRSLTSLQGAGGTAIVSTTSGATIHSIHLTLVVNGIFAADEIMEVPLNIRIVNEDKGITILEEIQKVRKPAHDVNVIELSSPVSTHDLRMLTRNKLELIVESRKNPELRIRGSIQTRVACQIFQTLLTPSTSEIRTPSSAMAWMYLVKDGSMIYNIVSDDFSHLDSPNITLIDDNGKRRNELEDVSGNFKYNAAHGIIDRVGPRLLESLYSNELAVNVAVPSNPSLLKGRLIERQVADSRDSVEPILLKRLDTNSPIYIVGLAWISVDIECTVHYEIDLNGYADTQNIYEVYLHEVPIEAPGAPVTRRRLNEFSGNFFEDFVLDMTSDDLAKLETSVCYMEIVSKDVGDVVLRGRLKSTKVPRHCNNNVPIVVNPNEHNDNQQQSLIGLTKCFYSGRFYDEGEQWKRTGDPCTICYCVNGRTECEPVKCAPTKCRQDEVLIKKGDCCPTCTDKRILNETFNNSTLRGCNLGDNFHEAGSSWHPFLPPNGYDTCTICTCDSITLEVNCPRIQCPQLNCPERYAYRPDKRACCKKCPEERRPVTNPEFAKDQGSKSGGITSTEEILANGGCKISQNIYENGQEWHPTLPSHGEQKCVKCRCKDSKITCDRKKCTKSICNNRLKGGGKRRLAGFDINQMHEIDECCSTQCKRSKRHQNQRRRERENSQRHHTTTGLYKS